MNDAALDAELVKRVQAGDRSAFDVLVRRYQSRIQHLIGRYVYDSFEAQDVAQEAFIKAFRAIRKFRGDSAFYTWMYRIAINTAKNHLVAQGRRPPGSDIDAGDAEQFDTDTRLRHRDTPEHELLKHEIRKTVEKAVADLPEDLRTAITLREVEGLSYEEIAQVMACPIGTVRSRIFRAREAVDQELAPLLGEKYHHR